MISVVRGNLKFKAEVAITEGKGEQLGEDTQCPIQIVITLNGYL